MGALLLSASSFANEKFEKEKDVVEKEDLFAPYCTAYLHYNGKLYDSIQVCGMITQVDNCRLAQQKLLDKYSGIDPTGQI